jgi:hypothetical protein
MIRYAFLLLALPMAGVVAQAAPLLVRVNTFNAVFEVVRLPSDSAAKKWVIKGNATIRIDWAGAEGVTLIPADSSGRLYVEVLQRNQKLASFDGGCVTIHRNATGYSGLEGCSRTSSKP